MPSFCHRKSKNELLSDSGYCYSPVLSFLSCTLFALKSFAFDNKSLEYIIIKGADVKMSKMWIYSQINTTSMYDISKDRKIEMYKIQTHNTATTSNI